MSASKLNLFFIFTISALKIKYDNPGENKPSLIEGQTFYLQYILPTNRFRLLFLKNNSFIAEKKHVRKNVFHIRKVAPTDEGCYCAKVENIRSEITQLTVQCKLLVYICVCLTNTTKMKSKYKGIISGKLTHHLPKPLYTLLLHTCLSYSRTDRDLR